MSQINQDVSTDTPVVVDPLAMLAFDVSLTAAAIPNPAGEGPGGIGTGITTTFISSSNSCAAIDLANGSCEFFNIWFLAKIDFLP